MDLTKLDRTARALGIAGLLAFIDTFLTWGSVTLGSSTSLWSGNAWSSHVGFLAWFSMLLLLALGVVSVLPAFGVEVGGPWNNPSLRLVVTAVATLLVLLSLTGFDTYVGADFGFWLGLVISIAATGFAYMGFTAAGGSLNTLFQQKTNQQ